MALPATKFSLLLLVFVSVGHAFRLESSRAQRVTVPRQTADVEPVPVNTELTAEDVPEAYSAAVGETPTEPELEAVKELDISEALRGLRLAACGFARLCNLGSMALPIVDEWVHATSAENLKIIKQQGCLRGNRCNDTFFDGPLTLGEAPRGTWFNANLYRHRPVSITPYPENVNGVVTVPGLAFNVSNLLGEVDGAAAWQLFFVSDKQRGYRQIKYAISRSDDDCFEWLCRHLEPVPGNMDEHVELLADEGRYQWRAVDAEHGVLINVFMVNDSDDDVERIPIRLARQYAIRKLPAKQVASPGRLVRQ